MGQINIAVFNGRRKAKNDLDDPLPPGYLYRAGSSLRYPLKGGLERNDIEYSSIYFNQLPLSGGRGSEDHPIFQGVGGQKIILLSYSLTFSRSHLTSVTSPANTLSLPTLPS